MKDPQELTALVNLIQRFQDKEIQAGDLEQIELACITYPNNPRFANFFYDSLLADEQIDRARGVLSDIRERFPDYLFGRINEAKQLISDGAPEEEILRLLGERLYLPDLMPEREVFHLVEFLAHQEACVLFQLDQGEIEDARQRYRMMEEVDPDFPLTKRIRLLFRAMGLLAEVEERREEVEELKQKLSQTQKRLLKVWEEKSGIEQWSNAPVFHHPEIEQLYEYGFDLPDEFIRNLLALPRKTLIEDLRLLLLETVYRHSHHYHRFIEDEDCPLEFGIHAIFLLAELQATACLPDLLFFLKQASFVLDFWLGDTLTTDLHEVLYRVGNQDFERLQAFMLNPQAYGFARAAAAEALTIMWHDQPEQQAEVLKFLTETVQKALALPLKESEYDDHEVFCTSLIGIAYDLQIRDDKLDELINELFAREMIDENMYGDQPMFWAEFGRYPSLGYTDYTYPPIVQRYQRFREILAEEQLADSDFSPNLATPFLDEAFLNQEPLPPRLPSPVSPIVNSAPKVGRNDPCPCGSGKKYKKCCLKKA
ncbi:MAG: DUF1186 domain-containing protein [Bacteroidota bacterium]